MMDQAATRAVEDFVHAGYRTDVASILLCESDGTREEVADEIRRVQEVLEKSGAVQTQVSRDEKERLLFWAGRKAAFPAAGRISPDYYCMDGTIPRKRLGEVLRAITELERKYGLRCANVFHAGDGNLHPAHPLRRQPAGRARAHRGVRRGDTGAVPRRSAAPSPASTASASKRSTTCASSSAPPSSRPSTRIKRAFDEHGLLNPGKAVPTLHRCAEFGRMHVHAGQQKFPELPRF